MSGGTGKYTQYAAPASDKNEFMNRLFRSEDAVLKPLLQDLVGKETEAREATVAIGNTYMKPVVQQGDPGFFPAGVNMDYTAKLATIQPPNTAEGKDVVWTDPGDPANSFYPDITSPGPGKTDGLDKDSDPKLTVADIKPNYVPAAPGTGTKSPSVTNAKIIAASILGVPSKLGDSGGNI